MWWLSLRWWWWWWWWWSTVKCIVPIWFFASYECIFYHIPIIATVFNQNLTVRSKVHPDDTEKREERKPGKEKRKYGLVHHIYFLLYIVSTYICMIDDLYIPNYTINKIEWYVQSIQKIRVFRWLWWRL